MKTLKTILTGTALFFAVISANAAVKTTKAQPTQTDVLNMYIADISTNTTADLDKVLDNKMQFNLQRGQNVNTLNKNELIDYLKKNTVVNAPVNTNVTVVDQDDDVAKVKVVFTYNGFTRTDMVTLSKINGWKVTNVDSTYN